MSSRLPPVDPDLSSEDAGTWAEEAEYKALQTEARFQNLSMLEKWQAYILRWVAMGVGIAVVTGMATILWHLAHLASEGELPTDNAAFLVALVVGPISSITAITIALFIGAFKKFEDVDVEKAGQAATAGAAVSRSL